MGCVFPEGERVRVMHEASLSRPPFDFDKASQ